MSVALVEKRRTIPSKGAGASFVRVYSAGMSRFVNVIGLSPGSQYASFNYLEVGGSGARREGVIEFEKI